jgi:hypothetical protein
MRTVSYTVLIVRNSTGYTAVCPTFPNIKSEGRGVRVVYAKLKKMIKDNMLEDIERRGRHRRDVVVEARTLRFDLEYLLDQEELR